MRYELDTAKNLWSQRKHEGISFEMASLVFKDPYCLVGAERADAETRELRWHAAGAMRVEECGPLVVHVYRENRHGEEVIRIISASTAEEREVRRHREQAME